MLLGCFRNVCIRSFKSYSFLEDLTRLWQHFLESTRNIVFILLKDNKMVRNPFVFQPYHSFDFRKYSLSIYYFFCVTSDTSKVMYFLRIRHDYDRILRGSEQHRLKEYERNDFTLLTNLICTGSTDFKPMSPALAPQADVVPTVTPPSPSAANSGRRQNPATPSAAPSVTYGFSPLALIAAFGAIAFVLY